MADTVQQSRNHRYQIGDAVKWADNSEWPPVTYGGTISRFANDELTYLEIEFTNDAEGEALNKSDQFTKVLTEDDVSRG